MQDWIFSYGTLREPQVQQALFGRELESFDDALDGFEIGSVEIKDEAVRKLSERDSHPILRRGPAGSRVSGCALKVTESELAVADRYETDDYARLAVTLASGRDAFVYVDRHDVSLVTPNGEQLQQLLPVARDIFSRTFSSRYQPAEFEAFCEATYAPRGAMAQDFSRADVHWQVAVVNGPPIGYAKLTPLRAPASDPLAGAVELQQIYVLPEWHGKGVAAQLMDWGLAKARALGAPEVYLTVFDHNERAKRFYARYGFEDVGRCEFKLGDRVEEDRIWRLRLS